MNLKHRSNLHLIVFTSWCVVVLMLAIGVGNKASATLINSSFDNTFNGWQGQVDIFDGTDTLFFVDVNSFSEFSNSFSVNANTLTLTTALEGMDEVFGVYLFQSFTVGPSSQSLSLTFNAAADFFQVALFDSNLNLVHDFNTDGMVADLSMRRGQSLSLEFAVSDEDFVLNDTLTVSNILLSNTPTSVPEPFIFSLLLLALTTLVIRR